MSVPPRVSVVMAVHNGARYLDESIESILAQDFTDLELIIVDDGSRDATASKVQQWVSRDARIVSIVLEQNRGQSPALNAGIARARGNYIARQDDDDISEPARIGAEVAALDRDPSAVLVSTNLLLIDAEGKVTGRARRAEPPDVVAWFLHFTDFIGGHGQVMMRRDALLAAGGYSEEHDLASDYELWIRLMRLGSIVVLPMYGMRYRQHSGSLTQRIGDVQRATAKATTIPAVAELLGRELSDEEQHALFHLWYTEPERNRIVTADRIMREAYRIFESGGADRRSRSRARYFTAWQMIRVGAPMLWHGHPREFLAHLVRALRWHPWGCMAGLTHVVSDVLRSRR